MKRSVTHICMTSLSVYCFEMGLLQHCTVVANWVHIQYSTIVSCMSAYAVYCSILLAVSQIMNEII